MSPEEFPPAFAVPSKCGDCGVQCELRTKLVSLQHAKESFEQVGEDLVGETGEMLDQEIDALVAASWPDLRPDEIKKGIRQLAGENLNGIDEQIDATENEIRANALACNGVLKLRATKGDVTYIAPLCTSQRQYIRDGSPTHIPVHVQARSAQ